MLVHAAGESSPGNLPSDTYAVVLAVANEAQLAHEADRLEARGVALVRVYEPDRNNELMAVGLRPGRKEALRRMLSCLPLLR